MGVGGGTGVWLWSVCDQHMSSVPETGKWQRYKRGIAFKITVPTWVLVYIF